MSNVDNTSCVVMVFAKAPLTGTVKTRLGKKIGMKRAEKIYRKLLCRLLGRLEKDMRTTIQLWCWPDTHHPFFLHCARHYRLTLHRQQGKNLGEKMLDASKKACRDSGYALIVGSDLPDIDSEICFQSLQAVQRNDLVLVPTLDGGYGLIAMNKPYAGIFKNIKWSSDSVLSATLRKAQQQQLSVKCMNTVRDVDTYTDYRDFNRSGKI